MPTMPFDNLSDLGPTNVPPRRFSWATLLCVLMLFHMLVLQAGQKITGFFWYCHATKTEVIRLSPIPFATLPIVLQVIGATITQSASHKVPDARRAPSCRIVRSESSTRRCRGRYRC